MTDDTLRGPADYEQFTILAPQDYGCRAAAVPDHLSMVAAAAAARGVQNYVTFETDFGPERTLFWQGIDFTVNARLRQGLILQFGTSTGRSSGKRHLRDTRGRIDGGDPTTIEDLGNATTSIRSRPRSSTGVVHNPEGRCARQRHGALAPQDRAHRHLAGTEHADPERHRTAAAGRWSPPAIRAWKSWTADHRLFADKRRTQIDMRFAKILRFGSGRLDMGVDLGNLLNTNYTTTYENTYQSSVGNTAKGGTWNNPTAIYSPRFVRWNLTVDF